MKINKIFLSPPKKVFSEKPLQTLPDEIGFRGRGGLSEELGGGISGFGVGSFHFRLETSP